MLLGLDVGVTEARAVAIDEAGTVVASASEAYPVHRPRPGWFEQDPADWWRASRNVLTRVRSALHGEVTGLGLAGQMHGAVFLGADGEVVRPAILWNDQRAAAQCAHITERVGEHRLFEITGNPTLTAFQAPKILWLRDVEPVQYRHTRRVLLPKDYVRLILTGEMVTDASDASGTQLLDLRRRAWSDEVLSALEIPIEWLPHVQESPEVGGGLRPAIAAELGLPPDLPVAAGAADHAAAAIGTGIVENGLVSSSIGADGVLLAHLDAFAADPLGRVLVGCHAVPQRYHLATARQSHGGALRWWRDILGRRFSFDELSAMAESAPPGSDGLFFLPHLAGVGTSQLGLDARGAFVGLRVHHTPADLTRAVMEGVVFSLREGLDVMRRLGAEIQQLRATGGGARSALWRQMQADVFGVPVVTARADQGPAYGAALLAGVASGVYPNIGEAATRVRLTGVVTEPNPARAQQYELSYHMYAQLSPALRPTPTRPSAS